MEDDCTIVDLSYMYELTPVSIIFVYATSL